MEGGDGGGVVDASVGTIVWVRRRNGSWWPGRILGPDELAESHLLSPRSGTPVKLLGREDASVDWYNLEKSKRVKAFRCGEFDACIERAEAAQGVPIKKREKYARREDAILHALELEKKQLECRFPNQPPLGPAPVFSMTDEPHMSKPYKFHGAGKKADVVSHRYKSKKPASATSWDVLGNSLSYNGLSNSKKRPLENAGGEPPVKKKDRRRPLLQVLQSSPKLLLPLSPPALQPIQTTISHAFDTGAVLLEETSRGIPMGAAYSAKNQCAYLPTESEEDSFNQGEFLSGQRGTASSDTGFEDFLQEPVPLEEGFESYGLIPKEPKTEPVTETEIRPELRLEPEPERMAEPDSETETETEASHSGTSEETDTDVEGGPELLLDPRQKGLQEQEKDLPPFQLSNNFANTASNTTLQSVMQSKPKQEANVSKWNIKGKRNIRTTTKRPSDLITDNGPAWSDRCNGSTSYRDSICQIKSATASQGFYQPKEEFVDDLAQFVGSQHDYKSNHSSSWNGYFENATVKGNVEPVLIDVDLQVQASYQGERVPLVSLMSRLNGKAIVGHPVQIEIVEDGSTSVYLPNVDSGPDDSSGLPPVWRTGRRTVMQRVPRSMIDHPIRKKPVTSKSHKKSSKKVSARQKSKSKPRTKTISSLGGSGMLGGFIKSDGGGPLVTCVPVKIVFSRILEAVGRPSLHRVRMPSPAVRDPP
ncbi:Tudor/PWWP/MBT superfamily protein [Rhynchospora pubera]|uniref:Tudor/PWWP/MBT superfamily protein n=1 Tax=Rhynchospora pubera TaxID=906938 RepID=A0AAV8BWY9_9POAL|nr:Tudor/PWWP/MBT superfamily protein [Rhynchospora pubera]